MSKFNLDENTLVIFDSDQGNGIPFAKWTLYEAGVKSAMIAHYPSVILPKGQETELNVINLMDSKS